MKKMTRLLNDNFKLYLLTNGLLLLSFLKTTDPHDGLKLTLVSLDLLLLVALIGIYWYQKHALK